MNDEPKGGSLIAHRSLLIVYYWGPLAVWLAAIFFFSSDAMSAGHTSRFIEPLLRWLLPSASPETILGLHIAVRKAGHVTEYALLGLLAFRAVRRGRAESWRVSWAAAAFAIAALYSLVDEYHQSFVGSRTASLSDCLTDALGALLVLALLGWWRTRRTRGRRE